MPGSCQTCKPPGQARRGLRAATFNSSVIQQIKPSSRRGLTLLELLLALALTVLLLALVAGAMRFQLFTLDSSRGQLEEAQLARAIMRKLSADIRSTVQEAPIDFSAVSKLAEGTSLGGDASQLTELAGSDAAAELAGGDLAGGELAGLGGEDPLAEEESFDMEQMTTSTTPSSQPGLYGTTNAIQIDVSRLPRLDEYQRVTTIDANGQARTEFPSDVKTVTYYLRPPQSLGGATTTEEAAEYVNEQLALDPQQQQFAGGLVRREVDRAVALWKTENMPTDAQEQYEELLATEVVALQFRYFDGLEWLPEWDATIEEGLPLAIEIALVLDAEGVGETVDVDLFSPEVSDGIFSMINPDRRLSIYRQVVNLPLAKIPAEEEPIEEEESLEESSSESDSSESMNESAAEGGGR